MKIKTRVGKNFRSIMMEDWHEREGRRNDA